jgi:HSP20 family molecular chaperone IbpA
VISGMLREKQETVTMADVIINKRQKEKGQRAQAQGHAPECERGLGQRALTPFFSMTLHDFLAASPFELMRRFTDHLDRLFEGRSWSTAAKTLWSPSIAISEKDGQIRVFAELPGMSKDDVRVELSRDELVISGDRKREQDDRFEEIYWNERFCSSFIRTIPIPEEAQVEKAKAWFENEILTVSVPVPSNRQLLWVAALEEAQELN